ncbi:MULTISPECIES: 16S rRNA (guanine(527)-N(7))-methyltransferase RsmG [Cyanophyceae]|uniref:16S rRNA (guanine(527)-N(7))-methyltransferase RsmG n=1 Tax=Cyanophyceae TaxID=3028117 RepID=UPI00168515DE|nr:MULTISPECIES: 16S rRNA (guanine(527)-N(7))-methyltransferase RsmG [Cyanophyceae]MBD1914509.1 16S rRNA (guanine(527)-N(7))-methyltransferase RsmG [Phormidium sp. FACHB-77]MBD2031082.1 16S rRNA (guanine(527)-N(7))-methyltransferase RsmG [Phormidium sp. FACHB-322]MBD2052085.1 16S rRNA (guanine(527)-N(7))-methyltransferase RsmG [Leptolyngbya sp. FACHB-60]
MDVLPSYSDRWQSTLHWQPSDRQQQNFQLLYDAILTANQQVNLTRITTPEDFWEKHLWDSLQGVAPWLSEGSSASALKVVDVGTGGGFPGLPVALVFPHWAIALLDATRKKLAALETVCEGLGIANVSFLPQRAEQVAHQPTHREAYNLALLRAVGPVNTCAEYALPLLTLGGQAILYRGQWSAEEEAGLTAILPRLGGKMVEVRSQTTPITQGVRHNVILTKTERTPDKFPRLPGIPSKTPLV